MVKRNAWSREQGRRLIVHAVSTLLVCCVLHGCSDAKTSDKTYEEFMRELDEIAWDKGVVTKKALIERMGEPEKTQVVDTDIYLYYPIKGGMVQIVTDRHCWEKGAQYVLGGARKLKPGKSRPRRPDDIVGWYLDQGGQNPYQIVEKPLPQVIPVRIGSDEYEFKVDVLVLEDGKPVKTFSAKGGGFTRAHKTCTVTHHLKGDTTVSEEWLPRNQKELAGIYVIRDGSGKIVAAEKYFTPAISETNPRYKADQEQRRAKAEKKAKAAAEQFIKTYAQYAESLKQSLKSAKENANSFVKGQMSDKGTDAWLKFSEDWEKENTVVINEPLIFTEKINKY